jgi:hypothetical protein
MHEYLFHWQFWVAVILVAFISNWMYDKFTGSTKQLV